MYDRKGVVWKAVARRSRKNLSTFRQGRRWRQFDTVGLFTLLPMAQITGLTESGFYSLL